VAVVRAVYAQGYILYLTRLDILGKLVQMGVELRVKLGLRRGQGGARTEEVA
jgi:hypothetical protein